MRSKYHILTDCEKLMIIHHSKNMTCGLVGKLLGIHRATVYSFLRRFEQRFSIVNGKSPGKPRVITNAEIRRLIRTVRRNPISSIRELKEKSELSYSSKTITRYLKMKGYGNYCMSAKMKIKQKNREKRILFATKFIGKSQRFWNNHIFIDESSVILGQQYRKKCWRLKKEILYDERPKQFSLRYIKFCAAIGINGPIYIQKIQGKFNSESFIEFLKDAIIKNGLQHCTLVFDNDTRHTSAKTLKFMNDNNIKFLYEYPPESADTNLIEHIWHIVKKKVYMKPFPKNLDELNTKFIREFYSVNQTYITNLYFSMKNRLKKILESKGGPTKY